MNDRYAGAAIAKVRLVIVETVLVKYEW